ncbi:MAG TPA: sugar transferase, partial [Longimicrobiales bacterium]|nr:sugar transferase [Longimicrobiales bacterium]
MRLFLSNEENVFKAWLLAGDLVLVSVGLLAVLVASHGLSGALPVEPNAWEVAWVALGALIQCTCLYVFGLYDIPFLRRRGRSSVNAFLALAVSALPILALVALPPVRADLLWATVAFVPLAWGTVLGWRAYWLGRRTRMAVRQRVLFVLADERPRRVVEEIAATGGQDFEVSGILEEADASEVDLRTLRRETGAQEIVYSVGLKDSSLSHQLLEEGLNGVPIRDLATVAAVVLGRVPVETISNVWGLGLQSSLPAATLLGKAQRVGEMAVAGVLLLLALPILAVAAAGVMLDSPGAPFFVQHRLGYMKREFPLFKLRTMRMDAEQASGPVWSTDDDPRVTRFGSLLRRTGLDELPQLLNVLRGEMSFIGPRPIRRHFAEILAADMPFYDFRFLSRPGVTGWAQVR